jgi:hypothetical protein
LYCADAFAQQDTHGLGRTTCDTKWLELRKPPSEYASYIEDCMRDPQTKETAERARKEAKEREDKRSAASSANFVREILSKDDNLPDDEAKRMIELFMNGSLVNIPLGLNSIVGGPVGAQTGKCGSGVVNAASINQLKAAQVVGLVSIVEEAASQQFRQGQNFSWGKFLETTTQGVQQKLVVSVTDKGRKIDVSGNLPPSDRIQNCLRFMEGKFEVTRVVRNELQKKGTDEFRVVFITYRAEWSPYTLALVNLSGGSISHDRKAIMLFKNDPFRGKWKFLVGDYGDADKEFTTNNVNATLAAAK